jgi:hypothetical protein
MVSHKTLGLLGLLGVGQTPPGGGGTAQQLGTINIYVLLISTNVSYFS